MDYETYDMTLTLCGIALRFQSELPLRVSAQIEAFHTDAPPNVTVQVRDGTLRLPANRRSSSPVTEWAATGEWLLCAGKNGRALTSVVTRYRPDFSAVEVLIDAAHCGREVQQLCRILQCFPMPALLSGYGAVLLHSSRVEIGGRAIVFSAPSQTGKTTQARIWRQHFGARITSNDRTIVRRMGGETVTSGFPVDGSEPVCDPTPIPLGAVVLLRQGAENRALHLPAAQAMTLLMEQTALDRRDGEGLTRALLLWSEILAENPVFLLTCTPDARAADCLRDALNETEGCDFVRKS